jgi:hypothetical protein
MKIHPVGAQMPRAQSMRTEVRADGQNITKLIVAFRISANAPKNTRRSSPLSSIFLLQNKYFIFVHIYLPLRPNSRTPLKYTYFSPTAKRLVTFFDTQVS